MLSKEYFSYWLVILHVFLFLPLRNCLYLIDKKIQESNEIKCVFFSNWNLEHKFLMRKTISHYENIFFFQLTNIIVRKVNALSFIEYQKFLIPNNRTITRLIYIKSQSFNEKLIKVIKRHWVTIKWNRNVLELFYIHPHQV